jgi:PHD/YefM family antitoxin component YafN of YafNO toxin-antitoxin module
MREDYEPYTIKSNGKTYWCFDVEYYGRYICQTEEELKAEIKRVKKEVKGVLKDIEKQNADYYKRIEQQEKILQQQLKEARQRQLKALEEPTKKSKVQINAEREQIREYIYRGYNNGKILLLMPETSMRTIAHVRHWLEKKELERLLNDDLWK